MQGVGKQVLQAMVDAPISNLCASLRRSYTRARSEDRTPVAYCACQKKSLGATSFSSFSQSHFLCSSSRPIQNLIFRVWFIIVWLFLQHRKHNANLNDLQFAVDQMHTFPSPQPNQHIANPGRASPLQPIRFSRSVEGSPLPVRKQFHNEMKTSPRLESIKRNKGSRRISRFASMDVLVHESAFLESADYVSQEDEDLLFDGSGRRHSSVDGLDEAALANLMRKFIGEDRDSSSDDTDYADDDWQNVFGAPVRCGSGRANRESKARSKARTGSLGNAGGDCSRPVTGKERDGGGPIIGKGRDWVNSFAHISSVDPNGSDADLEIAFGAGGSKDAILAGSGSEGEKCKLLTESISTSAHRTAVAPSDATLIASGANSTSSTHVQDQDQTSDTADDLLVGMPSILAVAEAHLQHAAAMDGGGSALNGSRPDNGNQTEFLPHASGVNGGSGNMGVQTESWARVESIGKGGRLGGSLPPPMKGVGASHNDTAHEAEAALSASGSLGGAVTMESITGQVLVLVMSAKPVDADAVLAELVELYINEEVDKQIDVQRKEEQARQKKRARFKSMKKVASATDTGEAAKKMRTFPTTAVHRNTTKRTVYTAEDDAAAGTTSQGNLLAKYAIVAPSTREFYRSVFDQVVEDEQFGRVDHGGAEAIHQDHMIAALKQINKNLVNDKEIAYMMKILDIMADVTHMEGEPEDRLISFDMFVSIAALSEKVSSLDKMVKHAINDMDFDALHVKMMKSKELFLLNDPGPDGCISLDSLTIALQTGRMEQSQIDGIRANFEAIGADSLSFFDFLSYIPLFVDVHDAITEDPMAEEKRVPLGMFAVFRVQKYYKIWKKKALAKFEQVSEGKKRWMMLGDKMRNGTFEIGSNWIDELPKAHHHHEESVADVAAWKLLDEERISSSDPEIWFAGGLIRQLEGTSRILVDRLKGAKHFEETFAPNPDAKERITECPLLIMTCRPDLPSAVFISTAGGKAALAKNFGRGPAFPYVTISSHLLRAGFTLSFEPEKRVLRLFSQSGELKREWTAVASDAGSADAGVSDLQGQIDNTAGATLARERRAKVAQATFHDTVEADLDGYL
jgi:hypothetical protein